MATTARDKSLPSLRPTEADTAPPEQTALPICMSPKGFGAFRAALANARVDVTSLGPPPTGAQSSGFDVVFESPSQGLVRFGWSRPLEVAGEIVPISEYPRHASPWAQQSFADRRLLLMDAPSLAEGYGVWIDFEKGVRRAFGPGKP